MKRVHVFTCCCVVMACGMWPMPAGAQLKLPKIEPFGIDGLRLMLQNQGLQVSQAGVGAALEESPESTVLVILGDLRLVPRFSEQMERFVLSGGALLIASDAREKRTQPTQILGAWVQPERLRFRRGTYYQDLPDCPIVTRFARRQYPLLFEDVQAIVANIPSRLLLKGRTVEPVAFLPSTRPQNLELMGVFRRGSGRMLFVADHSIFINEMLIHADNARFANNVCRWLCEGGKRSKLVVIHDGRVLSSWGLGDNPPAIPLNSLLRAVRRGNWKDLPIGDSVLPVLNASIADYQQTNQWNIQLQRSVWRWIGTRSFRALLLILAFLTLGIFVKWLLTTPGRLSPWPTRLTSQAITRPGWLQAQRHGQCGPYLQSVLLAFFDQLDRPDSATGAPRATWASGRRAGKYTRDLKQLWALAHTLPKRITPRKMEKHLDQLDALRQLQQTGQLRLE